MSQFNWGVGFTDLNDVPEKPIVRWHSQKCIGYSPDHRYSYFAETVEFNDGSVESQNVRYLNPPPGLPYMPYMDRHVLRCDISTVSMIRLDAERALAADPMEEP